MGNTCMRKGSKDETDNNTRARIPCFSNRAVCNDDHEGVAEAQSLKTILDLPFELLSSIFQWLDYSEIAKCARVCKRFNEVSKDPQLFRNIAILSQCSEGYAEWMLNRTTNPKKMYACEEKCSRLISVKLGTWNMLEELCLVFVNLIDVEEGSLENLKTLSVVLCTLNCKTFGKLLGQSKNICKINLDLNTCSQCGMRCDTGHLPSIDFNVFSNSIEEVSIRNMCQITQQYLNQLSSCINLKKLDLHEICEEGIRIEATLAMGMVARKCLKLEEVIFWSLNCITDEVLAIFFKHCTNLKEVYLWDLSKITEKSCLMAINVLPQLQYISIEDCLLVPQSSEIKLRAAIEKLNTKIPPELLFG